LTGGLSQPELAFDEAIHLLDRGEGPKAEALLELVIGAARRSNERVLLARALCVLGEWLHEQGRTGEAWPRLAQVLEVQVEDAGSIAYERRRARELLAAR